MRTGLILAGLLQLGGGILLPAPSVGASGALGFLVGLTSLKYTWVPSEAQ